MQVVKGCTSWRFGRLFCVCSVDIDGGYYQH